MIWTILTDWPNPDLMRSVVNVMYTLQVLDPILGIRWIKTIVLSMLSPLASELARIYYKARLADIVDQYRSGAGHYIIGMDTIYSEVVCKSFAQITKGLYDNGVVATWGGQKIPSGERNSGTPLLVGMAPEGVVWGCGDGSEGVGDGIFEDAWCRLVGQEHLEVD